MILLRPLLLAMALFWPAFAQAEDRIALVVGNGSYEQVSTLENAVPDATLIAETLTALGFRVSLIIDGSLGDLRRGIAAFGRDLRSAGPEATGLFYYAGHGVQSYGTNYLLPVDTALNDAADLDLVALEASSILRQMFSARNRTNIFILDACRNNPFEDIPSFNDNGLAEMKAPTGTFLSYATAPGDVAYDGTGVNSPFTAALAREMSRPGVAIEQMFRRVRVSVIEETRGAQTPWDSSSLTGEFQFNPARLPTAAELADRAMWTGVRDSGDPLQIMLYLRAYPDSPFAEEARAHLAELVVAERDRAAAPPQAPPPAPAPVVPQSREENLIETARNSGRIEDYQAYLLEFPTGVFAQLAMSEIVTLREAAAAHAAPASPPELRPASPPGPAPGDPAAGDPTAGQDATQLAAATPPPDETSIREGTSPPRYDAPIAIGSAVLRGQSIAQLITGSPIYPPIEGLPENLWKSETCSSCHSWTRAALCDQGQTYLAANAERSLSKKHPYGGGFKQTLRHWAQAGCN